MKTIALPDNHPSGLTQVKFGRRRPDPSRKAKYKLRFGDYSAPALPAPPASIDYSGGTSALVPSPPLIAALRQVLMNDKLGDCTIAGYLHIMALLTGNAGAVVAPTDAMALTGYETCGNYVPGDPSTDNGCDEETVLDYLCEVGFPDGTKLAGYVQLDGTNQTQIQQAAWLFGNLYFGVDLPDAWVSPFPSSDGFVWDAANPDPQNGHCVVGVGYGVAGVQIDTWGLFGTMTWAAIARLCTPTGGGQLFALLSPDQIARGATAAPNGFDWNQLQVDVAALGGRGGNMPAPSGSTPTDPGSA